MVIRPTPLGFISSSRGLDASHNWTNSDVVKYHVQEALILLAQVDKPTTSYRTYDDVMEDEDNMLKK